MISGKQANRARWSRHLRLVLLAAGARVLLAPLAQAAGERAPVDIAVELEQCEFLGDWAVTDIGGASGGKCLVSGTQLALPAATAIEIPRAGRYYLWIRAMDFSHDRPGTRLFTVSVGGRKSPELFGDSRQPGFGWEAGGAFDLEAGPTLLAVQAKTAFARADALLLTSDPDFRPAQPLAATGRLRRQLPAKITTVAERNPTASPRLAVSGREPVAQLANEFVRIQFLAATRDGSPTVVPQVEVKSAAGWKPVKTEAASEAYTIVEADAEVRFDYAGFFPQWKRGRGKADTSIVEVGGVRVTTAGAGHGAIWNAGQLVRFFPRSAHADGQRVRVEFHASPAGALSADWELRPGERAARVRLVFTPARSGQFALGYQLFFRRPLDEVRGLLLPMMWHRRRLPEEARTLLDPFTPTPVALAEVSADGAAQAWAIVGEPAAIPYAWPNPHAPHFGLAIRDDAGAVQPAIYGPVPGTDAARCRAGQPVQLEFRVLVQAGDWYAGFRTAADEVCGLRDYRTNVGVSLTEAALNMIDLLKDDDRGGWWERGKGFYQIETKNGVTHASPLTLLSLYRISGDEDLYRRRALPAMEYVLSRRSPHFSPLPHDTGRYDPGGMDGPVKLYGTATLAGFWEMTRRRTPAFAEFALPPDSVRPTAGYSHVQPFDDWLARYAATGDRTALERARALADDYIEKQIRRPPATELGAQPFFFISFVPDWEGLLRLYEITGERRYLDAAAFGARQLMTGLWTQPLIPDGERAIHPGGQFKGDTLKGWRGEREYRLGAPRRPNDTPEHRVPAWIVSNVGLGFEQPSTFRGSGPGRMIYQMGWAPDFLRLARYTGDAAFETCARNAVLGRWANYPGYYATGFTDLPLNPRYPYDGPDVTDFYYHHVAPHLAWTIDYLVAEAEVRSNGKIAFPGLRQNGYAYFDARVYGHAPGRMFDADVAWLWLKRGLVTVDNVQLNFLPARASGKFFVVLMNESGKSERATVHFASEALRFDPAKVRHVAAIDERGDATTLPFRDGAVALEVPARGLRVLRLDGAAVAVPQHRAAGTPKPGPHPGYVVLKIGDNIPEARAAALQVEPGAWDAFVWSTASPDQATEVTLHFSTGREWEAREDREYPFEFSLPVADARTPFRFYLTGRTADGKEFRSAEAVIGAPSDS